MEITEKMCKSQPEVFLNCSGAVNKLENNYTFFGKKANFDLVEIIP